MLLKFINKYLIYFSIIFLSFFLLSQDYLKIPEINNYKYFIISLFLLLFSLIFQIVNWHIILNSYYIKSSFVQSFISMGLFLMTKYIPGKIWGLLGKAGHISKKYNIDIVKTSYVSFIHQLTSISSALLFSVIGIIQLKLDYIYLVSSIILFIVTLFFLMFQNELIPFKKYIPIIKRFSLKPQNFNKNILYKIISSWLLYWIIIGTSFYLLSLSILEDPPNYEALFFLYPISTVIGMILLISPGGVGIREGALVMLLSTFDYSIVNILSIAITIRVMFVVCEFFIFSASLVLNKNEI